MSTGVLVNPSEFQILLCYHHHQTITNQPFHQCVQCHCYQVSETVSFRRLNCRPRVISMFKVSQQPLRHIKCRNSTFDIVSKQSTFNILRVKTVYIRHIKCRNSLYFVHNVSIVESDSTFDILCVKAVFHAI